MAHRVGIWRRAAAAALTTVTTRHISTTPEQIPTLYSFLRPSIFALNQPTTTSPPPQTQPHRISPPKTLTIDQLSALPSSLHLSISNRDADEAWKTFKAITCGGAYPNKHLFDSLIRFLCSVGDKHSLKRAFAASVYVIERKVELVEVGIFRVLFEGLNGSGSFGAVFALVKCMFRNRVFVPFEIWGDVLIDVSRKSGDFAAFLGVFEECCRVGLDEGIGIVMPDLEACNAALEGCCRELESVGDAERVVELMARINVRPDEMSFGWLGYLYALKGMDKKVNELEMLMGRFGFGDRRLFFSKLISGFVKAKNLECVTAVMLRGLRECGGEDLVFGDETFM